MVVVRTLSFEFRELPLHFLVRDFGELAGNGDAVE